MEQSGQRRFISRQLWWTIILIIVIVGASLFAIQKDKKDTSKDNSNNNQSQTDQQEESCSKGSVVFTAEFTDFSKIDAFQPIGSITGASRGRSYITISKGETVPVYAPMDANLVSIIYAFRGAGAERGEYGFKFNAGCDTTFLLDHLDSISDELSKYAPAEPSTSTATNDSLSIPIKAGTLLGYSDGTAQGRTFDFLVTDSNLNTFHIKPSRWEWEQSLYSVCPYDLFTKDIKTKYYQKIGLSSDTGFIKAESCGQITYDIAGTISGGWFLDDKSTDMDGEFLLIGATFSQVDLVVKNDSEKTNLRITDYSPKVLPKDVLVGQSVCYKGFSNDWVYVHLIDTDTIEIKNGNGSCPTLFSATGAKKYYR
ncbi:MAG: hypothetical protein WC773_02985 [Patescibacteria group bacterium]